MAGGCRWARPTLAPSQAGLWLNFESLHVMQQLCPCANNPHKPSMLSVPTHHINIALHVRNLHTSGGPQAGGCNSGAEIASDFGRMHFQLCPSCQCLCVFMLPVREAAEVYTLTRSCRNFRISAKNLNLSRHSRYNKFILT